MRKSAPSQLQLVDDNDGTYIAQYPGCLAHSVHFGTLLPLAMGLCTFHSTISTPLGIRNRAATNSALRLHVYIYRLRRLGTHYSWMGRSNWSKVTCPRSKQGGLLQESNPWCSDHKSDTLTIRLPRSPCCISWVKNAGEGRCVRLWLTWRNLHYLGKNEPGNLFDLAEIRLRKFDLCNDSLQ